MAKVDQPLHLVPEADTCGDSPEDTDLLQLMLADARNFVAAQPWCEQVRSMWFGDGIGKIVLVAAAEISPVLDADNWVWLIVGDLPRAYVSAAVNRTPREALAAYCESINRWCIAVVAGQTPSVDMQLKVAPTAQHAEMLSSRVAFLRQRVLPHFR